MIVPTSATVDTDPKNITTARLTSASESSVTPSTKPNVDRPGSFRKVVLLCIFCIAQFLDTFNISSLYSAIPTLEAAIGITPDEAPWLVSAFQLTFASFLLMSGKISDVYSPKWTFIIGVGTLGAISLGTGFVNNKIVFFVLRAIIGISASLTIPSALSLIVQVFPEPKEQARAISLFGGSAGIGNVLGLIIGAIFVQYASWRWVLWFPAIIALPASVLSIFLIPQSDRREVHYASGAAKLKRLDIPGVSGLTIALILLIFALTSAASDGWGSASVLAPLIISIAMVAGFFFYERMLPVENAAIPSQTWFIPNFSALFAIAMLPFFWWTNLFTILTTYWQDAFQWSAISTAVHMLPVGVVVLVLSFTGSLSRYIHPKYIILPGLVLMCISTILLALDDAPGKYWTYSFPAFIIGSAGSTLTYVHSNVAIFQGSPPSMAGTVGAMYNGALQIGSAIGLAIVGSIQNGVNGDNVNSYAGRKAAFWFTLAVVAVEFLNVLVFLHVRKPERPEPTLPSGLQLEKVVAPEIEVTPEVRLSEIRVSMQA